MNHTLLYGQEKRFLELTVLLTKTSLDIPKNRRVVDGVNCRWLSRNIKITAVNKAHKDIDKIIGLAMVFSTIDNKLRNESEYIEALSNWQDEAQTTIITNKQNEVIK